MPKDADELYKQITDAVQKYGARSVERALNRVVAKEERGAECTILVNEGIHHFPHSLFKGEKYIVYKGGLDFTSEESLRADTIRVLIDLGRFLKKKKWSKIFLVISGHAAICMQVKLLVYRLTHIETTDLVFDGRGNYLYLDISLRDLLGHL